MPWGWKEFWESSGSVFAPSQENLWGYKPTAGQMGAWSPEQQQLMTQLSGWLGKGPGGQTGLEQTSLAGLEEWAKMMAAGGAPQAPGVGQAPTPKWQEEGGGFEDYYQEAVSKPMMEQFKEEIIPEIRSRMAPAYWSSERLGMEEEATGDLIKNLVRSRADLAKEERTMDISRYQAEVGAGLGFGGLGLQQYGLEQQGAMMPGMAALMGMQGAGLARQPEQNWLQAMMAALGLKPKVPYTLGGASGAGQAAAGTFGGLLGGVV